MPSPPAISESLAILCSGLFAGAALYISFVEHPARMLCGTRLAITQFAPAMLHAVRGCLSLASSLMFLVLAIWR